MVFRGLFLAATLLFVSLTVTDAALAQQQRTSSAPPSSSHGDLGLPDWAEPTPPSSFESSSSNNTPPPLPEAPAQTPIGSDWLLLLAGGGYALYRLYRRSEEES